MNRSVFILVFLWCMPIFLAGQRITRQEYIETYKSLAVTEMHRTGIPASITIAQGILESGDGNSTLARKANNHFGIKCHDDWKGKRVYHDDDKRNECFRKYKSVYESFYDHSEFLVHRSRYRFLFDFSPTDYKEWARGLKRAGYATSPTYAKALIRIIEENKLYKLDQLTAEDVEDHSFEKYVEKHENAIDARILTNNHVKYVLALAGEDVDDIAEKFEKFPFEIARYNGISRDASLQEGQIVYLQPKRRKAKRGNEVHLVKEGDTMHSISQQYAVRLDKLYKRNDIEEGKEPNPGDEILLRKRKKSGLFNFNLDVKEKEEPEQDENDFEIEFDG